MLHGVVTSPRSYAFPKAICLQLTVLCRVGLATSLSTSSHTPCASARPVLAEVSQLDLLFLALILHTLALLPGPLWPHSCLATQY